MRHRNTSRAVGAVVAFTLVLTSCGLAATMSPALAPDTVSYLRPDTLAAAIDPHPADRVAMASSADTTLLAKVAFEPPVATKPTVAAASVAPMRHLWQSLNNCGPASVVMLLSTFGIDADQEEARLALRGPDWRRGMSPAPVDGWVEKLYGLHAIWRNNGTNALMKTLISNGFAPMVTQWMEDPSISRIAHWRAVAGYDDDAGVFYVNDPMRGRGVPLTYQWFDKNWQPFSYRYLVVYKPEDEARLKAIVSGDWSERTVRQRYYERARVEALERTDSASWLGYGEASYQNGLFTEAVAAFEKGLSLGSAEGVFTLRSSYPLALRALGRFAEADAAQTRLARIGISPASSATATTTFTLDPAIAVIVAERLAAETARAAAERRLTLNMRRAP